MAAIRLASLILIATLAAPCLARPGIISADTELRKRPYRSAPVITEIAKDTQVDVVRRQGYWLKIKLAGDDQPDGWIKLFKLRYEATPAPVSTTDSKPPASGGFFANLARGATSLFGSSSRSSNDSHGTSTIGIRGLGAEDLETAGPNPAELRRLMRFTVEEEEAADFADEASLAAADMDYLLPSKGAASESNDDSDTEEFQ